MPTTSRLILASALATALGCATLRGAEPAPGQPAPALKATLLDGRAFDLSALRGKVVLVSFWATWCPPCRAEMPMLDAFYARHREQGLELVGISEDKRRDRGEVERVMQAFHFPAALHSDATANGFGAPAVLPILYVIDRNGVLTSVLVPDTAPLDEQRLNEAVLPLLGDGR